MKAWKLSVMAVAVTTCCFGFSHGAQRQLRFNVAGGVSAFQGNGAVPWFPVLEPGLVYRSHSISGGYMYWSNEEALQKAAAEGETIYGELYRHIAGVYVNYSFDLLQPTSFLTFAPGFRLGVIADGKREFWPSPNPLYPCKGCSDLLYDLYYGGLSVQSRVSVSCFGLIVRGTALFGTRIAAEAAMLFSVLI